MAKNTTEKYSQILIQAISQIRGQEDFVEFLRTELEWPIPLHVDQLEDVSIPHDLQRDFGFSQAEDRIQVSRLLNLTEDQPWGIFLFEFKTRHPYLSHLRQLLRKLSSRRTLQHGDPIWDRNDLLFICTQDWKEYQFVHFSGERPESAVISSFGWIGPDDRFLHTLCKHNLPRLRMPDPAPDGGISADGWRSQWRDAFNIKPVTDEFYATLKEVFHAVESGITGLQGEDRRAFTELMVNRLIFLKFVEKKGWLNNDSDYLFHHFQKFGGERYWKDFLFHLFFEGLNTDPAQRPAEASRVLGDVPYLNAELFSLSEQWNDSQVAVEGRSLDLLFDKLLNPYNFTVAETSPLEVEVAFNQDLLGYAYEELIADQHGQGAYYTHPTEVNLMCRESLRAYLEERCPQVEKEAIAQLVYGELSVTGGGTALTPAHAVYLYSALHDVTICDPAIGSGTFPVAMVKHLFTCLRSLGQILKEYAPFRELIDQATLTDWRKGYELKLHIIERSIYGCDIDYFAVQIAKLRFWIELMVECDQPVPLPNFDFKLLVGDALLSAVGTDSSGTPITLEELWGHPTQPRGQVNISADLARTYAERKKDYYGVQNPTERDRSLNELREDREQLIHQALQFSRPAKTRTNKHVLWQIDFAEIFQGIKPGFNIVIANPPYLRQELIDRSFTDFGLVTTKNDLLSIYQRLTREKLNGQSDLYIFFFIRAMILMKVPGGVFCFICSNSWLDVEFGKELQNYLLKKFKIRNIIENNSFRSFENADINTTINIFISKEKLTKEESAIFTSIENQFDDNLILSYPKIPGVYLENNQRVIAIQSQELLDRLNEDNNSGKWGTYYLRAPNVYYEIVDKLGKQLTKLTKISRFYRGITTGNNEFFMLDQDQIDYYKLPNQFFYPVLSSMQEIHTLNIQLQNLTKRVFVCSKSINQLRSEGFDSVVAYITDFETKTTRSQGKHTKGDITLSEASTLKARNQWWTLNNQAPGDFVIPRLFRERFYIPINEPQVRASDMFFVGKINTGFDAKIISMLLNSSLIFFFIELFGRSNVGGRINFYGPEINQILLPNPDLFTPIKDQLLAYFKPLANREVKKIEQELIARDRRDFDLLILKTLGIDDVYDEIINSFSKHVQERLGREKSA